MKRYIKCSTYEFEDLVSAILEVQADALISEQIKSTNDYRRYFKDTYGWDNITTDEFDAAWDEAMADNLDEGIQIGSKYYTLDDAIDWLDGKLSEYSSTYFFPQADKDILDTLISKFGNTYFWRD